MTATTLDIPFSDQSQPEVQAALEEHGQAAGLLVVLEEKVRDGDPGVKPSELAEARQVVEFAELRVQAAQRAAARRQADERAQQYNEAGAAARALTLDDDEIVSAFTAAVSALAELEQLAAKRADAVRVAALRASSVIQLADEHGERDLLRQAGIHNGGATGVETTVIVVPEAGQPYYVTNVPADHVVLAALGRVLQVTGTSVDTAVTPESALGTATRVFPRMATATTAQEVQA